MKKIEKNCAVTVYLQNPREMVWGVLKSIDSTGLQVQCIPVSTFDDWLTEISSGDDPTIGLGIVYYPLHRLEKMLLDEQVGNVPALQQRFYEKLKITLNDFLGIKQVS